MAAGSCSLMSDDLQPCPQGVGIQFVYNYNVERADMFPDHVGGVTLYVFDEEGRLVRTQTESNSTTAQPLRDVNYRMPVTGLEQGRYRLMALANQRDYRELQQRGGMRYSWTELREGEPRTSLSVHLSDKADLSEPAEITQMLDTLWYGTPEGEPLIEVKDGEMSDVVVSMIRDTKRLHLTLRQLVRRDNCAIEDYEITITDRNGILRSDNSLDPACQEITYRPWAEWNTWMDSDGEIYYDRSDAPTGADMTAHADIDFNRLMKRSGDEHPAYLVIRECSTGLEVARLNLASILAEGRGAFETERYSEQEYLDRAYDYYLNFILVNSQWEYVDVVVPRLHVTPWAVRKQRVLLE